MAEYVRDDYLRTVASGWGNALVGGAYTEALTGVTSSVQAGRDWSTIALTGTAAGPAYERLASATAAADVALAAAFRVAIALPSDHSFTLHARASGAVGDPVAYGARVTITAATGALLLELIRTAAGGAITVLGSLAYPAGTYALNAQWRLELQVQGAGPMKLRARAYPVASIPAGNTGWLGASDEAGPTGAGTYGLRCARVAPGASATSWWEFGDLFASDVPAPAFTATVIGLGANFSAAPSTGDFTAYSWNWGDGTAAGSGATPSHTWAAPGTYLVKLTGTTRWGATFTGQSFVTVAAPLPAPPELIPIVRINGLDVCDDLYSITWSLGREHWTDPFAGLTCSLRLRGIFAAAQGQTVTVAVPSAVSGKPLWSGIIDQVSEVHERDPARADTMVIAMDTASQLARWHVPKALILPAGDLPARLADLRPGPPGSIVYRYRYSVPVLAGRWLTLRKRPVSGENIRERTWLDFVGDALLASLAFGYTARDGAISYAPWEAPTGLSSTPQLNLDTGPDCAARVELDRSSVDGLVNRWTVESGEDFDVPRTSSIETYGERTYNVPQDGLSNPDLFPFAVARWDGMVTAMGNPATIAVAEVPVTDWAQAAITASPLDLALCLGELYSVMGVRHELNVGDAWRVTLSLDRNPWRIDGRPVP